ncbi:hypothetical protein [Paenibacillus kandeliae]|uniref:hypothetical protein n=1 Tax=Paenibacillus kandeliae TaxID=3231269 RepID=UPI00345AA323
MKLVPYINKDGWFLKDVLVDDLLEDIRSFDNGFLINTSIPLGIHKQRWDFKKKEWIEGLSADEIEQINNPKPDPEAPETIEQKLHRLEQADLNNKELIATLYEMLLAK